MSTVIGKIGLVGICGSGKSTLAARLRKHGFTIRQIAQEHSQVPEMWKRISNPDLLIYLDVSYPVTMQRKNFTWKESEYLEQERRLTHAREHADLVIDTNHLSPQEIEQIVLEYINMLV